MNSEKPKKRRALEGLRISLLTQVVLLFSIGIMLVGVCTNLLLFFRAQENVKQSTEDFADNLYQEISDCVTEYPAYRWLINYWYENSETMDIEYDVDFYNGEKTKEKSRLLQKHQPDLLIRYAEEAEIEALPEEDQKLYAEITYSWLITRINQIKNTYDINFLFGFMTDNSFSYQFFLFSAGGPGAVRGRNYEDIYTLGTVSAVSDSQAEGMKNAQQFKKHLADAGTYVDYYALLDYFGDDYMMIGLTFSQENLVNSVALQTQEATLYVIIFQVLLTAVFLLMMYFVVIRPLKSIQNSIRVYKNDKDSGKVAKSLNKIPPYNEIGQLSSDVVDLSKEIDDYLERIERITAEKERIGTELELGRRIQADMMPRVFPPFPDRNEFDIYASMTPAKEVGGDFYDFFLIDDDHICLVMADVSGKGVPAALFMMASKILLNTVAKAGGSPKEIFEKTNERICAANKEEMFVTVWLGILEVSTGKMTAVNAGHEYPVLKKPDGSYELLKDKHGFVIGGMEGAKYKEYEIQFEPGTKLFVYTDGVPEATNAENELFGTDRMLEALNADPDADPQQVLENVRKTVDGFVKEAEQFDDLTMLCFEYRGAGQDKIEDTEPSE